MAAGKPWEGWDDVDREWEQTAPADPYDPNKIGDTLIPTGTHVWGVVADQKLRQNETSKKIHIDCPFEIVYPPEYAGKWIWHKFWVTQNNMPYLKRDMLEILRWNIPRISVLAQNPSNRDLVGLGAEFLIGQEKDQNPTQVPNPETGEMIEVYKVRNIVKVFLGPYTYQENQIPPNAQAPATAPARPPAQVPARPPAAAPARPPVQQPTMRPTAPPAARPPVAAPAAAAPARPPAAAGPTPGSGWKI